MKKGWSPLFAILILGLLVAPVVRLAELAGRAMTPLAEQTGGLPNLAASRKEHILKNVPLSFEANQGQTASGVKFLARGHGYTLFLKPAQFEVSLSGPVNDQETQNIQAAKITSVTRAERNRADISFNGTPKIGGEAKMLRVSFVGADPHSRAFGVEKLPGTVNYFRGSNPRYWKTDIPTYSRVRFEQVYRGVDLVYYGNQDQVEYDFVVAPRTDLRTIHLAIDGAQKVEVTPGGDLQVRSNNGNLYLKKPTIYQEYGEERRKVEGGYRLEGVNEVSFRVAEYDTDRPIVIDPVLVFATYLGGNASDSLTAIQVDSGGNTYLTGNTESSDFPPGPTNGSAARALGDVFITKLNNTGTAVIFSTFLSGSNFEVGNALALDPSGNIYVTGWTISPDFPVANALQATCRNCANGKSAFVTKLNPSGSTLIYSTYLGGTQGYAIGFTSRDVGNAISTDAAGNAYVVGGTTSVDFPVTPGAFQVKYGGQTVTCQEPVTDLCGDAFAVKINSDGSALTYSTYLGGTFDDRASAVAVDSAGNAYITGPTTSSNFPTTPGAFLSACDPVNVCNGLHVNPFVAKLNAAGSALIYSSYLTGSPSRFDSYGNGIAVDSSGSAYVTGSTGDTNFPTTAGSYQEQCVLDSSDFCLTSVFVTKFNVAGSGLIYSTRIAANGGESGNAILVDAAGNAWVSGTTESSDFPLVAGLEPCGPAPAVFPSGFVLELNASGSVLLNSTCVGGGLIRIGNPAVLAMDAQGGVYVTGGLQGSNFPTTIGAFQTAPEMGNVAAGYVVKISPATGAAVAFDSHGLTFANETLGSTSSAAPINLYSVGSAPLNLDSVVATGDFTVTHNCGASVVGASRCTLSVSFAPTATGTRTGSIVVTDNAAGSPQILNLSGTGINPAVTLSPSTLTFGSQTIGSSSTAQNITLTNSGVGPLVLVMIGPQPPGDFQEADNCLGLVTQGTSCTLNVRFTPTAGGTRTATLTLTDNAQNSPQLLSLSGTGSGPGIAFSPTNIVFPNQSPGTTSAPQTVTVTNNGTATLTINSIQVPPAFVQSNTCGGSVAAGASCTLSITFSPPTPGNYQGALAISDNVLTSPQAIALSGSSSTGTPKATLSSNNLAFGTVLEGTRTVPQSTTLSNTGTGPLNISSIAVAGVDYSQTNNCGRALAAGANCSISVSYTPTSSGTNQTRVDITDDAANGPQSIALSGTGTEFLLAPAAGAPISQTVSAGATGSYSLTLTPSTTTRDTITLSCSGAPTATTCAVSPSQQTLGGSAAIPVSVTVATTSRSVIPISPQIPEQHLFRYLTVFEILICLFIGGMLMIKPKRYAGAVIIRWTAICFVLALLLLPTLFIGCGGQGSPAQSPPPGAGTPSGTYTLTVTGAAASSTNPIQTVTLTLKVN